MALSQHDKDIHHAWKQAVLSLGVDRLREILDWDNDDPDQDDLRDINDQLAFVADGDNYLSATFGISAEDANMWDLQTEALAYGAAVTENSVSGFTHVKIERKHGAIVANRVPINEPEEEGLIADQFREETRELVRTKRIRVRTRN